MTGLDLTTSSSSDQREVEKSADVCSLVTALPILSSSWKYREQEGQGASYIDKGQPEESHSWIEGQNPASFGASLNTCARPGSDDFIEKINLPLFKQLRVIF